MRRTHWRYFSGEQQFDLFPAQVLHQTCRTAEDGIGQFAFSFLQLQHFFLDRVARDQPVGEDRLVLPDAVGAVDGLRFHGRIPPGIEHEDIVGGGQVQAQATGLEADQEEAAASGVFESARRAPARSRVLPSRYS